MCSLLRQRLGRFCAMLAMALMLVFVSATTVCTVDDFEHLAGAASHDRHAISSFAAAVEGEHAEAQPADSPVDHPAGHHHHWENVSGLLAALDRGDSAPFIGRERPVMLADHDSAGFAVLGLERPPKASSLDA